MKRRKPDLLYILIVVLGMGMIITTYGSRLLVAQTANAQSTSFAMARNW